VLNREIKDILESKLYGNSVNLLSSRDRVEVKVLKSDNNYRFENAFNQPRKTIYNAYSRKFETYTTASTQYDPSVRHCIYSGSKHFW
jgi:hypothetical protein